MVVVSSAIAEQEVFPGFDFQVGDSSTLSDYGFYYRYGFSIRNFLWGGPVPGWWQQARLLAVQCPGDGNRLASYYNLKQH